MYFRFLKYLLFLLNVQVFIPFSVFDSAAQENDSIKNYRDKNFVYSYEGKLYVCTKVEMVKKIFEPVQIIADGKKLDAAKIKFIRNNEGFFANVQMLSDSYEPEFYPCEKEGKINLFSKYTDYGAFVNPTTGGIQLSGSTKEYINKGFGNLQKLNYKNVARLTKDNPECVAYLKKVKLARKIRLGTALAGVVVIPFSLMFFSKENAGIGIGTGAGLLLVANFSSLFIPTPAKAISIYNANSSM